MTDSIYAPFSSVPKEEKIQLLLCFAVDLKLAAATNDGMARFLDALDETIERAEIKSGKQKNKEIAVDGSRKIELKFDVSYNEEFDMYAWSFNGYNDSAMIKYANKYNFPRGCIVLWRKGKSIDLRGFYPKVCYLD